MMNLKKPSLWIHYIILTLALWPSYYLNEHYTKVWLPSLGVTGAMLLTVFALLVVTDLFLHEVLKLD